MEDTLTKGLRELIRQEVARQIRTEVASQIRASLEGWLAAISEEQSVVEVASKSSRVEGRQAIFTEVTLEPAGQSRRAQLWRWLRQHGPSRRIEIMEGTRIPRGTLATIFADPGGNFVNENGKWAAAGDKPPQ